MLSLAPSSTGNNTHDGVPVGASYSAIGFLFDILIDGGSATVDWKIQGSLDGNTWGDIAYHVEANNTLAVTAITVTGTSNSVTFLHNPDSRKYRFFRLVTANNTDATYRCDMVVFP